MKKLLAGLLLLVSFTSFSAGKYIYGEGRFWASEDDSLVFIKNQLLYTAFVSIITKELENMGVNPEEFWQKYNTKFEESFESTQEKLKKKYKIDEKPTAAQKVAYTKSLRSLKLKKKEKFMKLGSVIRSFAIKKMSRSAVNPQSRFMSVEAKVNRVALNKLFYRIIREKQTANYEKLYVMFEYELRQTNWSDVGVEAESSFTDEVNRFWMKWFQDNKPENVGEVVLLNDSNITEIKEHLKLSYEDIHLHGNSTLKSSLLLINKIVLHKEKIESNFNEFNFNYSGGLVLIDLATNRPILDSDIPRRVKHYFDVPKEKLSSAIANYVYRLPLDIFSSIKKKVTDAQMAKMSKKIELTEFESISQVMAFKKYLQDFGAKLRIGTELSSFNREKSEVVVFYQGDDTILMNFLTELKTKSKDSEVHFDFIDPAQPFQIKFVKKAVEIKEGEAEDQQSEV